MLSRVPFRSVVLLTPQFIDEDDEDDKDGSKYFDDSVEKTEDTEPNDGTSQDGNPPKSVSSSPA